RALAGRTARKQKRQRTVIIRCRFVKQIAGRALRRGASHRADVLRLRSLLSLGRLELDLLVLVQRPVARTRDRGEVDEHVRRSVIGGDETKALVGVEPLHGPRCHLFKSSIILPRRDLAAPAASLSLL